VTVAHNDSSPPLLLPTTFSGRGGESTGRGGESTGRGGESTGRGWESTGRGGESTGSVAEILPYGVDRITGNATSLNLNKDKALFPSVASTLESPAGPIQLLIGMDHMEEAPREEERAQGVALYSSRFGTGYVTGGDMTHPPGQEPASVRVLSCRTILFNLQSSYLRRSWGRNCRAGALHVGTARSVSFAWTA
jgi:hypothetical protein